MYEAVARGTLAHYHRRNRWQDFKTCFWLLNREAELQRLIAWARRKRLASPRKLYERRLAETQAQFWHLQRRAPEQVGWAKAGQAIAACLFPPPRYPGKGSAAIYKRVRTSVDEWNKIDHTETNTITAYTKTLPEGAANTRRELTHQAEMDSRAG